MYFFLNWQLYYKMSDAKTENDVLEPPCSKKIKIDEQNANSVSDTQLELKDFIPVTILNNNTNRKTVCIQGTFRDKSGVALVLLEKNAFKEEELDHKGYFTVDTRLHTFFKNDIYGNFECYPRADINGVKTSIIYPATDKHIAKFSQQEVHIILETPELYKNLTLPHIEKEQFNLQIMDQQIPVLSHVQDDTTLCEQEPFQQSSNNREPLHIEEFVPEYVEETILEYIQEDTSEYTEENTSEGIQEHTLECMTENTLDCMEGNTPEFIEEGTLECMEGNTLEYIEEGTLECIEENISEYIEEGTLECVEGNISKCIGDTSECIEDTSESMEENTSQYIEGNVEALEPEYLNPELKPEFFEETLLECIGEFVSDNIDASVPEFVQISSENIDISIQVYNDEPAQGYIKDLVLNSTNESELECIGELLPEFNELLPKYASKPVPEYIDEMSSGYIDKPSSENIDDSIKEYIEGPLNENLEKPAENIYDPSLDYLAQYETTSECAEEHSSESIEKSVHDYSNESSLDCIQEQCLDNTVDPTSEIETLTKELIDKPIPEYIEEPSLDFMDEKNPFELSPENTKEASLESTEHMQNYIHKQSLNYIAVPVKDNTENSTPEFGEQTVPKYIDKPMPIYIQEPSLDCIEEPIGKYIYESASEYTGKTIFKYVENQIGSYIEENTLDYTGHALQNIEGKVFKNIKKPVPEDSECDISQYIQQHEKKIRSEPPEPSENLTVVSSSESVQEIILESTIQPIDNTTLETEKAIECLDALTQESTIETIIEPMVHVEQSLEKPTFIPILQPVEEPIEKSTLNNIEQTTSLVPIQESIQQHLIVAGQEPHLVDIPQAILEPIEQLTKKCLQQQKETTIEKPTVVCTHEHTLECIHKSAISNQPTLITIHQPAMIQPPTELPPLVKIQHPTRPIQPTLHPTLAIPAINPMPLPALVPIRKRKKQPIITIVKMPKPEPTIKTKDGSSKLLNKMSEADMRSLLNKQKRAFERKRRFLEMQTSEQKEKKRIKERDYNPPNKAKKRTIKEMTLERKNSLSDTWRRNSAPYREKRKERKKIKDETNKDTMGNTQSQIKSISQSDTASCGPSVTTNINPIETTNNTQSEATQNNQAKKMNYYQFKAKHVSLKNAGTFKGKEGEKQPKEVTKTKSKTSDNKCKKPIIDNRQ